MKKFAVMLGKFRAPENARIPEKRSFLGRGGTSERANPPEAGESAGRSDEGVWKV